MDLAHLRIWPSGSSGKKESSDHLYAQAQSLLSQGGWNEFQAALANDGLPEMISWLKPKKRSKPLMEEVHKHILPLPLYDLPVICASVVGRTPGSVRTVRLGHESLGVTLANARAPSRIG